MFPDNRTASRRFWASAAAKTFEAMAAILRLVFIVGVYGDPGSWLWCRNKLNFCDHTYSKQARSQSPLRNADVGHLVLGRSKVQTLKASALGVGGAKMKDPRGSSPWDSRSSPGNITPQYCMIDQETSCFVIGYSSKFWVSRKGFRP